MIHTSNCTEKKMSLDSLPPDCLELIARALAEYDGRWRLAADVVADAFALSLTCKALLGSGAMIISEAFESQDDMIDEVREDMELSISTSSAKAAYGLRSDDLAMLNCEHIPMHDGCSMRLYCRHDVVFVAHERHGSRQGFEAFTKRRAELAERRLEKRIKKRIKKIDELMLQRPQTEALLSVSRLLKPDPTHLAPPHKPRGVHVLRVLARCVRKLEQGVVTSCSCAPRPDDRA